MGSRWWRPLVSGNSQDTAAQPARPPRKPALEALEVRLAPAVELVSSSATSLTSSTANNTSSATTFSAVSDDGRYVVYLSKGTDLVNGQTDSNAADDVFILDRQEDTTTLISHNFDDATKAGNGGCYVPVISGDGRWVAFFSDADDLIDGLSIPNGSHQLYLYDRESPTDGLTLVSYDADDLTASTGVSNSDIPQVGQLAISDNGSHVAYISDTYDLVAGYTSTDSFWTDAGFLPVDAYLYTRSTGVNKLVSHTSSSMTAGGNDFTTLVNISGDGGTVVFTSWDTNVAASQDDEISTLDIFRYDVSSGAVSLVTHKPEDPDNPFAIYTAAGSVSDQDIFPASISDDGKFITYASRSQSLVSGQTDSSSTSYDVFLYDVEEDINSLVSHQAGAATTAKGTVYTLASFTRPVISGDGTYVAFVSSDPSIISPSAPTSGNKLYLYKVSDGTNAIINYDGTTLTSAISPSISDDGAFVAFVSPSGSNGNVYLYSQDDGSRTLLSHDLASESTTTSGNAIPLVSGDGTVVAWTSTSANLVDDDNNSKSDVFVYGPSSSDTPTEIILSIGGNPTTTVPETPDTPFGTLSTNASTGTYTFTLVEGTGSTDNFRFSIVNGQLQTGPGLNFPNGQNSFQIRVEAKDNNTGITIVKPIELSLITRPTAILPSITHVLPSPNLPFATLSVPDSARQFTFDLVDGDGGGDNGMFKIVKDNVTGEFKIQTGPDFPPDGQYSFSILVRVTDAIYTSLTYDKSFTITLATTPTQLAITRAEVPALANTLAGRLSAAAPGDERPFTFSLVNGSGSTDNGYFSIDSNGDLRTNGTFPDTTRETQTYLIRVRAADKFYPDDVNYEQTFSITAIKGPTGITLSRLTIPAEAGVDGGTFSTEPGSPGRTYTYSLVDGTGDGDNDLFEITSSGALRGVTGFPDGGDLSYSIRVRITDSVYPSLFFDKTFTVTALPDPTDITLTSSIIEAAPNAAGGTFGAVADGTGRQFTFTLVAGLGDTDNAKFRITAGQLLAAPDFVAGSQVEHSIRVRVSDPNYPSVSYDEVFTISAVKAPTGIVLSPQVVPPEPNTDVGALAAQGGSAGRTYTYTLVPGSGSDDNGLFSISSAGVLRTGNTFPDGSRIGYSVRVLATDTDFPALSVEQAITVTTRQWEDKVGGFQMTGGDAVTSADGVSVTSLGVDRQDVGIQAVISIAAGSNESAGLIARYSGPGEQNFYLAEAYGRPGLTNQVEINLYRQALGQLTLLGRTTVAGASADGTFRFEVVGSMQKIFFADKLVLFANDTLLDGAGGVGLRASGPAGISMDDISYQPESGPVATSSFTDDFSTNYTSADMGQLSWQYAEQAGTNVKIDTSRGTATNNTPLAIATLRGLSERDQVVTADVNVAAGSGGAIGLMTRYTGPGEQNFYLAELYGASGTGDNVQVSIYRNVGGAYVKLTSGTIPADTTTHRLTGALRFEVSGPALKVFLGDDLVAFARDTVLEGTGPSSAGFRITGPVGAASVGTFSASKLSAAAATLPHDDTFEAADRRQLGPKYVEQVGNFRVDPGLAADNADGKLLSNASLAIATLNALGTDNMTITLDIAAGSLDFGSNRSVTLLGRYNGTGEGTGYLAELYARPDLTGTVVANLYRRDMGGSLTLLDSATTVANNNGTLEFVLNGSSLTLKLDGTELLTASDTTYSMGSAGFRVFGTPGTVSLDNFHVTSP